MNELILIDNSFKEYIVRDPKRFYNHLIETYDPERLRMVMVCNPRGGISSKLTIDSDWGARGGKERYNDWRLDDVWEVTM